MDGVLGCDFFQQFVVEINYHENLISLYEPKAYQPTGHGIPITLKQNCPYIDAKLVLPNRMTIEGQFLVDTGTSDTALLRSAVVQEHRVLQSMRNTATARRQGERGDDFFWCGRAKLLIVNRFGIRDPLVLLSKNSDIPDPGAAGIIGAGFLRRFTVVFDFPHSRMYLEPNEHFREREKIDMSGLDLLSEGPEYKTIRVDYVVDSSAGADAGLRKGDIIAELDGVPVNYMSLSEIRQKFRQTRGQHKLTVRRGGQTFRTTLKLKKSI